MASDVVEAEVVDEVIARADTVVVMLVREERRAVLQENSRQPSVVASAVDAVLLPLHRKAVRGIIRGRLRNWDLYLHWYESLKYAVDMSV